LAGSTRWQISENQQQGHGQQQHGRADDEQHVLQIEHPDAAVLAKIIGTVEPDAHAVDAGHGAPDGEQRREAEQAGPRHGEDGADLAGERLHQFFRGNAEQIVDDALGQRFVTEEAAECGEEDEKGKHREERAEGNVAGKRNRLVGEEPVEALARQ
jgi:hypothetical protein